MTLPEQSDRAVAQTREFLVRLASPYGEGAIKGIRREVRAEASRLLRHYPYAWNDEKRCVGDMSGAWIPVAERLPERGERVIVAHRQYKWSNARHKMTRLKRLGVRPATYWLKGHTGLQFCCSDGDVVKEPVAWMPLPSPPETTP